MSFNPKRLLLARRRRGLTQTALGRLVSVTQRTINAYEGGHRTPTDEFIASLAAELKFGELFFHRTDPVKLDPKAASFRSLSSLTATSRDRALGGAVLAMELADWIGSKFTLPDPNIPSIGEEQPEAAAEALRQIWGLGEKPVPNIVHLLEYHGVRVFSLAEDALALDAISMWKDEVPYVFLNTRKSAERSRFDAAHELGHLIMHRHGAPNGRDAEADANRFASAFLMPEGSVRARARRSATLSALVEAKAYWKVSVAALVKRLYDLRYLSEWHYRMLCRQMGALGYFGLEPKETSRESSQVLEKVFTTLRREGKRKSDVANELGWDRGELDSLVFGLVMTTVRGGANAPSIHSKETRPELRSI
jgi:Zn-dependent peptidase ImmA (M78 family)/transcriptional regulator with XRE-family HTH domain